MNPPLPPGFLDRSFAHRGLHGPGLPENSLGAINAAAEAGYGVEMDLQLSADGEAMVFHDDTLDRLTEVNGPVRSRTARDLSKIRLKGTDEPIPTLKEVLSTVNGSVPLLIEVKDQDGALGPDVGPLERAAADALSRYAGPVAVMSFNPHSVEVLASAAPDRPRGLVTEAFLKDDWPTVPTARLAELARIPDARRLGAAFISHDRRDLKAPAVMRLKAEGLSILTWTVRSKEQGVEARRIADAITFEHFLPPA